MIARVSAYDIRVLYSHSHSIDSSPTIFIATETTNKSHHFPHQKCRILGKSRVPYTTRTVIWSVIKLPRSLQRIPNGSYQVLHLGASIPHWYPSRIPQDRLDPNKNSLQTLSHLLEQAAIGNPFDLVKNRRVQYTTSCGATATNDLFVFLTPESFPFR